MCFFIFLQFSCHYQINIRFHNNEKNFPRLSSSEEEESSAEEEEEEKKQFRDIHSIDVRSQEFLSLPPEIRHEILTEMIETRKQNSWKHLDRMPKESGEFSDYQMNRLLKRYAVQVSLEQAGKEMGGKAMSLQELEELLGEQGVIKDDEGALPSKRIAQDSVTRYMLVKRTDTDQRPAAEERKLKIEEEKDFDITEHLQDVDWSSESDLEEKVPELVPENDVAEILAVLEDDKEIVNKEKVEVKIEKESLEIEESMQRLKDTVLPTSETNSENLQNHLGSERKFDEKEVVPIAEAKDENLPVKDVEPEEEKSIIVDKETLVTQEKNIKIPPPLLTKVSESEKNSLPIVEENPLILKTHENKIPEESLNNSKENFPIVEEPGKTGLPTETVSSDSESDFVPIEESEDHINLLEEGEKDNRLEVVIDPSRIDKTNDIFADVFSKENGTKEIVPSPPPPKTADEEIAKLDEEIAALDKQLEEEDEEEEMSVEEEEKEKEKNEVRQQMTEKELLDLQKNLEEENDDLLAEQGKQERHAQNVTEQMCLDAQVSEFILVVILLILLQF